MNQKWQLTKWMIFFTQKENVFFFFSEGSTILCSSSVSMETFVGGGIWGKNGSNFHGPSRFQEVSFMDNPMVD